MPIISQSYNKDTRMKKILILGANEKQIQLIKAAKEEGYYVVVCDYTSDNPGIPLADKHYQVSYLDQDSVLSIAKKEKIDGVIGNNDPAMPMVAYISDRLGLPGNSPETIDKLISKSAFRQFQEQIGLYCPKHIETEDFSVVEKSIENLNYPIIVKPSVSAGSQGTTKIQANQTGKLQEVFNTCKGFSRNGKVTIEEYVEMPTLEGIEGDIFVFGDIILWNGLFTTRRSMMAPMIPMTYIFPAILTQEKLSVIKKNVAKLFKEAGIRHGEYNIEMYFTKKEELFIIEVNPRQGGHLLPQQIKKHTEIDLTRLLVTTAVGQNEYLDDIVKKEPKNNFLTHHVVFSDISGILQDIEIDPVIRKYVSEIAFHKKSGEKINQRNNATDYIAYVTMQFPDRETQLSYSRERIEQMIRPIVKE